MIPEVVLGALTKPNWLRPATAAAGGVGLHRKPKKAACFGLLASPDTHRDFARPRADAGL